MPLIKISRMSRSSYRPSEHREVEARETKTTYVVSPFHGAGVVDGVLRISKITKRQVGGPRRSEQYYYCWTLNEVVGAQIISVPTEVPLQRAKQAFTVFMGSIAGVFVAIGVVLNLMLWALVIRPIGRLSQFADRVSLGELEIPEYKRDSSDEIGALARSIGRMRTSMVQAMKMLEG